MNTVAKKRLFVTTASWHAGFHGLEVVSRLVGVDLHDGAPHREHQRRRTDRVPDRDDLARWNHSSSRAYCQTRWRNNT